MLKRSLVLAALGHLVSSSKRTASKVAMQSQDELKKLAGYKAVDDYVRSGMVIGLGTGSTAVCAAQAQHVLPTKHHCQRRRSQCVVCLLYTSPSPRDS